MGLLWVIYRLCGGQALFSYQITQPDGQYQVRNCISACRNFPGYAQQVSVFPGHEYVAVSYEKKDTQNSTIANFGHPVSKSWLRP